MKKKQKPEIPVTYIKISEENAEPKPEDESLKGNKILYMRILVNFLLTALLVVLCVLFLGKILKFFLPFVIAFIVAAIANPMVRFLEKKIKLKRKHGSVVMIFLVLSLVAGILFLVGYAIIYEAGNLMEDFPGLMEQAKDLIADISNRLNGVYVKLPKELQNWVGNLGEAIRNWVEHGVTNFNPPSISTAGLIFKNVLEGLLIFIIAVVAAYFFIADRDKLVEGLEKIVPESVTGYYRLIVQNIKSAVGGYFKAQFKIMLIIVVILFIGFEALGVPYSFLLALLTAFLDFLPVFGTGTIIGPWAVVDIITGKYIEAVVLVVLYIVCQIIKQVLQPKMVGDSIGMNPLATLFFMFVGYRMGGILGMIIGIPVGMVLVNFYRLGIFDRLIRGAKILAYNINKFRKY